MLEARYDSGFSMDAIYRNTPPVSVGSGGQVAETSFTAPRAGAASVIAVIDVHPKVLEVDINIDDENPYDQINTRETLSIHEFDIHRDRGEPSVSLHEVVEAGDGYANDPAADALSVISVYTCDWLSHNVHNYKCCDFKINVCDIVWQSKSSIF